MSKKFLSLIILGLCYQGIDLASAKIAPAQVVPQCDTFIRQCESMWKADKWKKNPAKLSKGINKICGAILTTQQTHQWPGILEWCKKDAKQAYGLGQEKKGACSALVFELHDTVAYAPKYKSKGEYCTR